MDYETMLNWAHRIKARCLREGKSEQDRKSRYAWTGKRGRADGSRAA